VPFAWQENSTSSRRSYSSTRAAAHIECAKFEMRVTEVHAIKVTLGDKKSEFRYGLLRKRMRTRLSVFVDLLCPDGLVAGYCKSLSAKRHAVRLLSPSAVGKVEFNTLTS
jgi:hypothetical protein